MNQNQPKDYFDSIIGSTNQVTGSTTSTTQPKDYFDSIVGSTNNAVADTTSSTNQPMDYFDTILANQKNTQKDVTGLGTKQAEDFNAQLANFKNANPVLKYKTFEKYRDQYQSYLTQRGYSTGQIDKLLAEFNEKADPRNQTSNFEYYVGDRFNDVMIGGGNLIGDALAAVPETLPIVGEWADKWEKEYKNAVRDWQSDLSAKNQIQKYLGDKAEEEALKNGANEFTATLANVKANPMQITSLLTQQTPQLLLGGAGTKALGAINAAGGMGRERSDIEEAYERTFKENPQQLLTLPEIQSRMAKGMTLEDAVNDAKTDYSDNLGHILMGGVIGASEALTPTGRFMRGVNRGVAGTLAKEVGQEAFQEGAEKLNSNDAVGYIDGKTQLTDGVIKNATLGGIAGFGTGIPTAIEAGLNRNRPTDDQPLEDQIAQNSQPQSEQMAQPQPTTEVNGQAVDNVLNARQFESEEARKEYENELKSAIKEGSIQEAAKANTAFGQLARDYLAQTGQTVEPTPQVKPENSVINPEIERVLSLRDRMLKWREGGKLGDISDLLPTMMTFSDAEAKRDFAMKQAFSEVKSVAQKYGIDPNDGKAMFAWLNDYVTQRDNAQIQAKQTREDNYRQQYDTFLTGKAPQQAVGNSENSANPISDMTQAEQQLQQTANIAPSQDRNVVIGGTDTVDIGENNYQPFQYEVMEATDLAPTQQKAGNQLRDRDRASSQAQVTKIARNLDPRKLGESPTMEMGAPLLAQDGQTVIAGNGRSMAIRQAYQEGKGNGYRQFLQENATKFGLDPNQVAEMQNPVLIRRLNTAVDIKQTAINSNEQGGMRMSNLEQAKVDAGRLPNMAGFELGENGELNTVGNQGFISQFIQNQPETLRNELLDSKGNLSQTGVQRLRNAMLYNAYGDTDILARAVESTDQGARNIITALTRLAPTVAKVKQDMANGTLSDVDISNDIVSAVEKYNQLKSQNHNVDEYLQQQDFVSELSPEAKAVLRIFNENARSAKRISDVLGSYYRSAEIQGNTAQASMFGEETFDKAGALEQAKNADLEERHSRSPIKSVEANIKRGREAMHTAIVERRTVHRAMFNHNLDGWVDFEWGDIGRTLPNGKTKGAMGIAHIIESRMRKDNMNYMQATKMLIERVVDTLAKGQVSRIYESGKVKSVFIDYNGNRATLIKREGSNSWLMNAFELKPTDEQVGSNDPNLPTQTLPTRQRQGVGAVGSYNVQQSAPQSNPQIAQDQATLSRILGEDVARHIEVVDRNSQVPSGKNIKKLVTQGVEGWFESGSQKLYLISDNIEANSTFSRDERLAWVAWHELAHKGVRIKFGKILTNLLNSAGKHPTVKAIAQRIQVEYKRDNIDLSHEAAVEEAMMELFSAKETGNWQALADRYQVQIPLMVQRGSQLGKYFAQFANHFRRLIRTVLKRDIAMSDREVFETLQGIKQGIDQFAKNPQNPTPSKGDSEARYSLNERADSEFANAVPKRTASSFDEARAIVSELLGEPLTNKATGMVATISKRSLDKLVSGKAHSKSSSLEDHLTAVANIDQLFENAELGWIEPHKSDTVNIAGMHKLFAPLLLNGEMKLAKLTVKEMNFNQGNKIYSVETIEVENGKGTVPEMTEVLTGNSNIAPHRLHSASMQSLIQRIADFNSQSENSANDEQDTRYSRKAKSDEPYQRDLMVTHNISADGILHANKMGGLPYASVAVTRQQNPLTNFGEVTLIGDRNYIDPKGTNKAKVFGADIYSPRYPNVTYEYNRQDINWLRQQFETSAKEIDDNSFDYNFSVGLAGTGVRRAMLNSDTVKYQFLKEKGIDYETVYRAVGQSEFANYVSVKKAIEQGVKSDDLHNASSAEKYESLMREFIQEQLSELKKFDSPLPLIKRQIVFAENALNGDKLAVQNYAAPKLADGIDNQQGRREIDSLKTKSNMRKAVDENKDLFQAYVDRIADQMVAKEKIRKGENRNGEATYMPHTIENVVKKLKKDLRGGEAMNYGLPSVRAKVTPKFKSIEDIQKNKNRLVSHDDFQKVRDEVDTEKDRLAEALGINSWEIDDVLWNVVDENVQSAFHYADIENTAENRQLMADFLAKLEAMPTEYFEGKAKDITQFSDFIGAVVPNNLPKNAYDVLQKSGLALYEYDPTQPSSRAETIKQATDELDQQRNGEVLFSRKQSVADLIKTGKAKAEPTAFEDLKAGNYQGFTQRLNRLVGKVDEWFADSLRPVNDWANEKLVQNGISAHEANRLLQDMYRAKGVRDALNSELEQTYLKPLLKKVAEVAKANKLDPLTAKRLAGFWASLRYSIEKNQQLLKDDQQAMAEAKQALDDAVQNGTQAEIDKADLAYRRATRQYRNRKHDVETTDPNAEFKVGTAGGWSIPEAKSLLQGIEKHIPRADLEAVADLLSDLNQARLEMDFNVGRYTPEQYQEYKANRHYVPLTGDPKSDDSTDVIGGAGLNALNVSKDRALKGRKLSEAEDGIDASWRAIGNSTTYAGWADFKAKIDEIYQSELTRLKGEGLTEMEAKDRIEQTLGIRKARLQGLTRSSDDVLIRKEGGIYYEYRLPKEVMAALKNDNAEYTGTILKVLSTPTSWYARGVTQWTLTFAPMNMARDTWEKSEFIRVQKVYDQNGNELDSKTMDKIGRAVLKNAFFNKDIWTATKRFGFGQDLRQNVAEERLFKELLTNGGVSTYSTYLARTETDLIAKIKKENSIIGKRFEQAGKIIESYNQVFDNVSALSAYKALIDEGVDPKQAAAITLELTNFRKTGSKMKSFIKPLYMFSQPTAMGARNLTKYLATSKGRKRFLAYMVVMMALYSVLRSFDDENEGGNQMDQLGDITRYIPIPLGDKKYIKIPVGFGMPQMAWNYAVNLVKGFVGDISISEAATNMFVHTFKTMSPVSPSEISAAKYPLAKATLTVIPTIFQPLIQNALNRSAFGSQITTNFVRDDKLKAEQAKSTTAEFWKELALEINDALGIDMHPEQIKNLFDGYGSMFGSLKELQTIFIENPNREQLGRQTRTPFLNQIIGTANEFSIQSRYYEASEEAQTVFKQYESLRSRGKLDKEWLAENKAVIAFHQLNAKRMGELKAKKAQLTKQLREKKISPVSYEMQLKRYNVEMDKTQRAFLKRWRTIQGLTTY